MRLRRPLVALATLALLATAACSADVEGRGDAAPSAGASTTPTPSSAAEDPATPAPDLSLGPEPTGVAGGNATKVCGDALKASEAGTTAFVDSLSKVLEANGKGDTAAANEAEKKLDAAIDTWAAALRTSSSAATDAQLKTTLAQLADEVGKLTADIETIDDTKLGAIQDRLDALCPD